MRIILIMCISKILTDLCAINQKIKIKIILANVVYNVLVVKSFERMEEELLNNKW